MTSREVVEGQKFKIWGKGFKSSRRFHKTGQAEDSVKPSDDADTTKDDAEMECASDGEGPAETNRPDGAAASEDLCVSSSTSVAATTEHETEDAAKTCEATAEKEGSGDTSKDKLET
ncbi:hypothetical protein MRX96_007916 [Rhipicephalus microplus]